MELDNNRVSSPDDSQELEGAFFEGTSDNSNFQVLQKNLENCLEIAELEVLKSYLPSLQDCDVVKCEDAVISDLNDIANQIQFFRIAKLSYQVNEPSVYKLATMFQALSNKPCTLVLMIRSDGTSSYFYLGVRSRGNHSTATMKQVLKQSLIGLFPGSETEEYLCENMKKDIRNIRVGCISSVTCIPDYKQSEKGQTNEHYIQGLEKFVYSMQGKPYTVLCIANNLANCELKGIQRDYERIYTDLSPFSEIHQNYSTSQTSGRTRSIGDSSAESVTKARSYGESQSQSHSTAIQEGSNSSRTETQSEGQSISATIGHTDSMTRTDGENDSESVAKTNSATLKTGKNSSVGVVGSSIDFSVSSSVSRSRTHGTSRSESFSESFANTLTRGLNKSSSVGQTVGKTHSQTETNTKGYSTQRQMNQSVGLSSSITYTDAISKTFGSSESVALNIRNRSLISLLKKLDAHLNRLEECESIGMWDFAAYFIGESAAEAETAAVLYHALVSGSQTGLESAAINTWTDEARVREISSYIFNFTHPVFIFNSETSNRHLPLLVDATTLISTNELAIQLGLPRHSIKGLHVTEREDSQNESSDLCNLGTGSLDTNIFHGSSNEKEIGKFKCQHDRREVDAIISAYKESGKNFDEVMSFLNHQK